MAPPTVIERTSPAVVPAGVPPLRRSRLPTYLRLPILLVLNLGISSVLRAYSENLLGPELGAISKSTADRDLATPALLLVYKIFVIVLGWQLNYDCKMRSRCAHFDLMF